MTTADEGPRPTTPDDPIHLMPSGEIAVRMLGSNMPTILPRPSFGQAKELIRFQGFVQDTLQTVVDRASAEAKDILAKAASVTVTTETLDELASLRDEARVTGDRTTDEVQEIMAKWWTTVFSVLAKGKVPDESDWPSVFMDTSMPHRMVGHWRFVPSGPG